MKVERGIKAVSFSRDPKRTIEGITIHHWGKEGQSFDGVVNFFANDEDDSETSAHYIVGAGRVAQIVNEDDVAWHAGNWDANLTTLGLELRPEATQQDYEDAAWLIKDIRSRKGDIPLNPHSKWKATNCPGKWDLRKLDALARGKTKVAKACSPFHGVVTSGYLGYKNHIGMDIRPFRRWTYGNPVAVMLPGKVVDICKTQRHGAKTKGIGNRLNYGYRTGNGFIVENDDGEYQLYNHTYPDVKVGDRVNAGDIGGHNDNSGNQTGAHVHMEYLVYSKKHGEYRPHDPMYLFRKYGIKPGAPLSSTGTAGSVHPAAPKPGPTLNKHYPTVKKGSKNTTVGKVQRALKKQGYTKQIVDNDFGKQTDANVRDFQKRVHLVVDGIAGPITQKKLGL